MPASDLRVTFTKTFVAIYWMYNSRVVLLQLLSELFSGYVVALELYCIQINGIIN